MHTQSPRAWHGTELPRKPLLTTCGRDRQTHKQTDTGSPCPIPLILAPDIAPPPFFLPLPPTPRVPSPCKPSLPLGAGGESRSTLGTIRGLGGARVAGPGGGQGDMGAGVGGKKVQGNSGTISCWGGEGRRVGVKPLGSPSSPSACHLTGDSGGWRRALDASGRSRACSGLAALSSCVRQGVLPSAVAVGLAVAGAKAGGLGFRPLGDRVGGLPLGGIPWGTVT